MPKKKTEAAEAAPSNPAKKSSKPSAKPEAKPTKGSKKATDKPAKVDSAKVKEKKPKAAPTRKNQRHADIPNATVLKVLDGGKPLSKREIVIACGGDDVAVTKTIQRLRGLGQIVATGKSRSVIYSKSA